jgi:hypothetical protein
MVQTTLHKFKVASLLAIALMALLAMLWSESAAAADGTSVAAVQLPAWVERGGKLYALRPGMELQPGDAVITGGRGRVHLDTPDGSIVKLGADGRLNLDQLAVRVDAQGSTFDGALRVLKGAFRFTTRAVGSNRRRNLRVSVGVVTAGVRGTDIWGKSDGEKDLICLLEGQIGISSGGAPEQVMDQAMTFYVVPKGQQPLPIVPVDVQKVVEEWAPQTELDADVPVLSGTGAWSVAIASHDTEARSQRVADRLIDAGYPAEVVTVDVNGRTWYRVVIAGLGSKGDAAMLAAQLESNLGLSGAWLIKR